MLGAILTGVCLRKGSPASAVIPLGLRSFRVQHASYRQPPGTDRASALARSTLAHRDGIPIRAQVIASIGSPGVKLALDPQPVLGRQCRE
jgi:hypothetical protein